MPSTCSVCRHESRGAVDRALVAGTPLREIASTHGLSPSAVHRHRAGGHVHQSESSDTSTPDPNGPWVHLTTLKRLAAAVIHALPKHARVKVIDELAQLPEAEYIRAHIAASIDPDEAETHRRRNRGEVDEWALAGPQGEWRMTWFKDHRSLSESLRASREPTP